MTFSDTIKESKIEFQKFGGAADGSTLTMKTLDPLWSAYAGRYPMWSFGIFNSMNELFPCNSKFFLTRAKGAGIYLPRN